MRSWSGPILLSAALAAQAAPPGRVEIAYELRRDGDPVAAVTDRLEHDGRTYRLAQTWKGRGLYALRGEAQRASRGRIAPDGLRPAAFEDRRPGRDAVRVTPQPGGQDRLSVLWHLAFNPPSRAVTLRVADRRGVSTHVYEPAGRERVATPAGEFAALKLVRREQDRRTQIWLAAEHGNVPVRVLIREQDGATLELVAVRIGP